MLTHPIKVHVTCSRTGEEITMRVFLRMSKALRFVEEQILLGREVRVCRGGSLAMPRHWEIHWPTPRLNDDKN